MEHLYLHIGMGKTGTKSIQRGMDSLREKLGERGVCYPEAPGGNHGPPVGSLFVDDPVRWAANARWRRTAAEVQRDNAETWQRLNRAIDGNPRVMVLSGEGFFGFDRSTIQRMVDWICSVADDFRIVAYFREPRGWAPSYVQQVMKRGTTLDELLAIRLPAPQIGRLKQWSAVCGKERIMPFDFGAARRHPYSIGGHFAEQIGLPEFSEAMSCFHANASITISAEALAEIKALTTERGMRLTAAEARAIAAKYPNGSRITLPDDLLAKVEEAARPDLEWLEAEFGLRLTP